MRESSVTVTRPRLAPLYLAGFTTAFGAHGIAAALGAETEDIGWTLLAFGFTLALYDLAEVLLKPVFGALSDRIGVRPVIVRARRRSTLRSAARSIRSSPTRTPPAWCGARTSTSWC